MRGRHALRGVASGVAVVAALTTLVLARSARADAPRITLTPATMMLGVDRAARVDVYADGVDVPDVDLQVSVGAIHDVTRVGDGHFTARYEPPPGRAPDVAVFVLRVRGTEDPAVNTLPLAGRYHLHLSAEPGASVAIRLGETLVRRVVAPGSGEVDTTLHVPPGVDHASVEAVDRASNRTVSNESLQLPPAHRVLVLLAPLPEHTHHEARWWIVAADPSGTPAVTPPSMQFEGGAASVERVAPGLFRAVCRADARAAATRVSLRVTEPGVSVMPPSSDVEIPASIPTRMEVTPPRDVVVGDAVRVAVRVLDDEGNTVVGLRDRLRANVGGRDVQIEDGPDGTYVLRDTAPARPGIVAVHLGMLDGAPSVDSEFEAHAGPPARLLSSASELPRAGDTEIVLRPVDRLGNPTVDAHGTVQGEGVVVRSVLDAGGSLRVRVHPLATRVRLWLQTDAERTETLEIPVVAPPSERPVLSMGIVVRHNLHDTMFYGTRTGLSYALHLAGPWWILGGAALGLETALSGDAQGHRAEINSFSGMARAAILARYGDLWLGVTVTGGGRLVFAWQDLPSSGGERAVVVIPGAGAGLLLRWHTRVGILSAEVGGESGYLDTSVVRGTLGGIYGALAWGVRL